jgi:hypothetical protein
MNMPLAILNRRRRGFTAFSPSALFALAEPGVWYDPSDLTTLFTDTAGTTPVTTPGNTVALMLDKSKGLTLGTELVTNGDFASGTTGWSSSTSLTSTATITSEEFVVTAVSANGRQVSGITCVIGKSYKVTGFARVATGAGSAIISVSDDAAGLSERAGVTTLSTSATPLTLVFVATKTTHYITLGNAASGTGNKIFDNISVRELPGNHATQATAASRPTYGVVPLGGRRNLLTWSEDFRNTAAAGETRPWVWAVNTSVTANTHAAPDGTMTADTVTATSNQITQDSVPVSSGSAYSVSISIRKTTGATVFPMLFSGGGTAVGQVILNTNTGVANIRSGAPGATNLTVVDQGDYWRLSYTFTPNGSPANVRVYAAASTDGTSYASGLSGSCVVWGAQLELGSTATAYQRVITAFDVTETGVQSLSYLSFDGVDDFMLTGTITPGIDRAQVFAGVRKLSDAALGALAEFSANWTLNDGAFIFSAPNNTTTQRYGSVSRGNGSVNAAGGSYVTDAGQSPDTAVLCATHDIAGDSTIIRRNGLAYAAGTLDKGTGNFLAYPLYIGRRGGTTLPFNGNVFSLLVRFGANLSAGQITDTETWVNGKTGAY